MAKKKPGILQEFKTFILRGNVMDLAVGVIIGAAFQAIVNSLVNDVIMPCVGAIFGGADFSDWFVVLKMPAALPEGVTAAQVQTSLAAAKEAGATVFAYGSFITAILNFLILAVIIFLLVKGINRLTAIGKKKEEEAPAAPTTKICPFCKSEIAIEATRCPHCTSAQPEEEAAE